MSLLARVCILSCEIKNIYLTDIIEFFVCEILVYKNSNCFFMQEIVFNQVYQAKRNMTLYRVVQKKLSPCKMIFLELVKTPTEYKYFIRNG